jgi:dCTP deaminase
MKTDVCIIPPNSFALAKTVEYFRIPRDVLTVCVGKSTLRALRADRQRHAVRAEWEASSRSKSRTPRRCPAKVYANEGISQVLFFQSDEVCETSYADKQGKYQKQQGLTLPRL